jgi:hypothetical protein
VVAAVAGFLIVSLVVDGYLVTAVTTGSIGRRSPTRSRNGLLRCRHRPPGSPKAAKLIRLVSPAEDGAANGKPGHSYEVTR